MFSIYSEMSRRNRGRGHEARDLVREENVATLGHFRRQTPSQIDLSTVGKIFYFPELRCSVLNV